MIIVPLTRSLLSCSQWERKSTEPPSIRRHFSIFHLKSLRNLILKKSISRKKKREEAKDEKKKYFHVPNKKVYGCLLILQLIHHWSFTAEKKEIFSSAQKSRFAFFFFYALERCHIMAVSSHIIFH